jgi:hypothetical protein
MSYINKTQFCSHCKSAGKTYAEYTSHYVRKTPDQNSRLTCPELLKRVCVNCPSSNHTWDRCPLTKGLSKVTPIAVVTPTKMAPNTVAPNKPIKPNNPNRFSCFEEEEEQKFDTDQLIGLTTEDQKQCIGEEIYAKVVVNNQARAGIITGMLLEFDIPDLVTIVNDSELLYAVIHEANRVLDIAV